MKTNAKEKEWREHKNEPAGQQSEGSPRPAKDADRPEDRLKDGTNDFQNGDQDPSSLHSQKPGGERGDS